MANNKVIGLTAPVVNSETAPDLTNMTIDQTTSWGALGGFFYNGNNGSVTHQWSLPGISVPYPTSAGLVRGSYDIYNISGSSTCGVLVNPAPYSNEWQLGAMIGSINSTYIRLNIIKLDSNESGSNNQRYSGFSCTIFGNVPQSVLNDYGRVELPNKFKDGIESNGNIIQQVHSLSSKARIYGNTVFNSGILAIGQIVNGVMSLQYKCPNLNISYTKVGVGDHYLYTNIPYNQFSVNASHVFGGTEDITCLCYQFGSNIQIKSLYSRANQSWRDKNIFFSIYGLMS